MSNPTGPDKDRTPGRRDERAEPAGYASDTPTEKVELPSPAEMSALSEPATEIIGSADEGGAVLGQVVRNGGLAARVARALGGHA